MATRRGTDSLGTVQDDPPLILNSESGEVRTESGRRVGIIDSDLFGAICDAVHDKLGEEVRDVLYAAGAEWGRREFARFKDEIEGSDKTLYHIRNMSLETFSSRFNDLLTRRGWGAFDIEEQHDFILIHLSNSAYGEMITQHNLVYNDLFAGFFAGFFSQLIGVDFDAVEVSFSKKNFEGIYLLADESIIMTVRRWIEDGMGYDQILKSLEKRDYRKKGRRSAEVKEV